MLNIRHFSQFRSLLVSECARNLYAPKRSRTGTRKWTNGPEQLEVRQLLAADLSATLDNGILTISDISETGDDNSLSVTTIGTDLVVSDTSEQFLAAPAGGTLSDGGKTLTIPLSLISSGLTINAGLGNDQINIESIDAAFNANLIVNGDGGNDTVTFGGDSVNVGTGSVTVAAEMIQVNAALTVGGAVNLKSTGDDTLLSIDAPLTAGGNSFLTSDKMLINNTVNVGSHTLILAPETGADVGDAINIGAEPDSTHNTLQFSNEELNRIQASLIAISGNQYGTITISAAIQIAGDEDIEVVTGRNIVFDDGSSWTTHNGNIEFSANIFPVPDSLAGQNFIGVDVNHATLRSLGSGGISLYGLGWYAGSSNIGIDVHNGSVLESLGDGQVVLGGLGGTGTDRSFGVQISDSGTKLSAGSGFIRIDGTGGTGDFGYGTYLSNGASVNSNLAPITINGTGGNGNDSTGIIMDGNAQNSQITSVDGNITLTGQGGNTLTGLATRGVIISNLNTEIQSTGTAKITITGTGGSSLNGSDGVVIGGNGGGFVTSVKGDIQITGQGGAAVNSAGVRVTDGGDIESTGSAKIKITGTGGNGDGSRGVLIGDSNGGRIETFIGDVSITGTGGSTLLGDATVGVTITDAGVITSHGTAKIFINGTGGTATQDSRGVEIGGSPFNSSGGIVASVDGDIQITGQGGDNDSADGVWVYAGGAVQSSGLAKILINGTGGDGNDANGVVISAKGIAPAVSSVNGNIQIAGQGGNSAQGITTRGVEISNGAIIQSTGTARIIINGTGGASTDGSRGVEIGDAGTKITSATGDIQVTGLGGPTVNGFGIWFRNAAVIESTGTAKISLDGTAGEGSSDETGVVLNAYQAGGATQINSVDGDITITGHGGHGGQRGVSYNDRGVGLYSEAMIQSTGAARIIINGTGGSAGDANFPGDPNDPNTGGFNGIEIGGTLLSTGTGNIELTGHGGADGGHNIGISEFGGASIQSTGTGQILLTGTGGMGLSDARGIEINNAAISSVAGDILLNGHGGLTSAQANIGVWLVSGATISATGSARISIDGTGDGETSDNTGVELNGFGYGGATHVTTQDGDITIVGHGSNSATGVGNRGIAVVEGATIESTGLGKISLNGTAGTGADAERGVEIGDANTKVASQQGDISISGQGGTGTTGFGVFVRSGSTIVSTGAAKISINGTGGQGTDAERGIELGEANTKITSQQGDISITGQGGSGSDNFGIFAYGGAAIQSTGTAQILLNGTGGTGVSNGRGVQINDATITSVAGDIHLTGQGGADPGRANIGVWLVVGATVTATGNARIAIDGTGGGGTDDNTGVEFNGFGYGGATHLSSQDGDITIIGNGSTAAIGAGNRGIAVLEGATITSTGLGKISLNGTAGIGVDAERGVEIGDTNTSITAQQGDISVTGHGGTGTYGFGIWVRVAATVASTGSSRITIDGTGGPGGGQQNGVILNGYGTGGSTSISSVDGDILITGRGGDSITNHADRGFGMYEGAAVVSTGTAKITIHGIAGSGIDGERGVEIGDSGTRISSARGDISITGQGGSGTSTSGTYNVGVEVRDNAVIESTATSGPAAKITIDGTGGAGSGADIGIWITTSAKVTSTLGDMVFNGHGASGIGIYDYGVDLQIDGSITSAGTAKITVIGIGGDGAGQDQGIFVEQNSAIRSVDGDIQITGHAGSGGDSNLGVGIQSGSVIESTGTAKITVAGTGGSGTNTNHGVRIYETGSMIRSAVGDIQITGVGGSGTTYNSGVDVQAGAAIVSTGTAKITVTGTGGTGVFGSDVGAGQVGVWLLNSDAKISAKDGDVTITGIGGGDAGSSGNHGVMLQSGVIQTATGGAANVSLTGTAGVGSASFGIDMNSDSASIGVNTSAGTGNVTLVSDSINIDFVSQPAAISAGTNRVTIQPKTGGTQVNLGGTDALGTLGLSDGELDRVTAAKLNIGNDSAGTITVSTGITRLTPTNLRLVSGGDVVIAGGQVNTDRGTLVLDPGLSPHVFNSSHSGIDSTAFTTTVAGALSIIINNNQVDTGYTQFNVVGGIDLTGANLVLSGGYVPAINESFVIINNDGGDAVTGKFNGLNEGASITLNGRVLRISYVGGDGNDVVLTAVNVAPVATDLSITTPEDAPYSGTLVANDTDSPALSYSIVTNASHGTVNIINSLTGAYIYTPNADYHGPDSFTFKANDGSLDSNVATVSIAVESVNDAPQLNLNGGSVTFSAKAAKKGGPIHVLPNVTVSDPDQSAAFGVGGGTLSLSIAVSGKQTKKTVKLDDTIGGISNTSSIGTASSPTFSNGKLLLTIHLNANATTAAIQAVLRGITFSTKGAGLKLTHRAVQVQLTDAAGGTSNLLQQTIIVTK
ncbi:MAG: hypothetical protein JWM11_1913 [Planctomycetaceae bacterium]|nr:hypothetical protein [Planctomycetaceae bacterium]